MPMVLEFRAKCSDTFYSQIEAARGEIPLDKFLIEAVTIGLGHIQEEIVNQQHQKAYERLAITTEHFRQARETQDLAPMKGANVTSFPDLTKPPQRSPS
jgi:hypothetical protein